MKFYRGIVIGVLIAMPLWAMLMWALGANAKSMIISGGDDWTGTCAEEWMGWTLRAYKTMPDPVYFSVPTPQQVIDAAPDYDHFFALAHGWYGGFWPDCGDDIVSADAFSKRQFEFAFFGHCGGMCKTGPGTLAYSAKESVGYCHMSEDICSACWDDETLRFQEDFFALWNMGQTVKMSFDVAIANHPWCAPCIFYNETPGPTESELLLVNVILPMLLDGGDE